ncbi:MAG: flagellar basal body rod protein FlgB [Mariprofundus sp.]|nr:flagellar basal body rod protein FlgB [Mariprofundus sp.]
MDMLGNGFQRLKSAIIAREHMQTAITSNIANADTPNYRADQRGFAEFFAEQSGPSTAKMTTTNRMHISDTSSTRLSGDFFQAGAARKMDGNGVDVQTEMARMSENQLMHDLSLKLIKGKLSGLLNAIKEGR